MTLALNISGCPNGCPGCHSAHLQQDTGEPLDGNLLASLLETYGGTITCVCFMGGDAEPGEVVRLAHCVRTHTAGQLKTAWYSGKSKLLPGADPAVFDYIKLGPYVERLGGLDSPTTNQRLYRVDCAGAMNDITDVFRRPATGSPE